MQTYEGKWEYIEDNHYEVLADVIFQEQEVAVRTILLWVLWVQCGSFRMRVWLSLMSSKLGALAV